MKTLDYAAEPWFSHLDDAEQARYAEWDSHRQKHREEASIYAHWMRQASDRAKARMKAKTNH